MKFEEAIEKINDLFIEPCIPGYSSGDFAPEFLGQIEDLEEIIEELQETYAPKIKMPQKIMLVFMEMKFNYQVDFEFFWKLMGDCVATDYLRENYKEEEIMIAWLHPELIEVTDD